MTEKNDQMHRQGVKEATKKIFDALKWAKAAATRHVERQRHLLTNKVSREEGMGWVERGTKWSRALGCRHLWREKA